MLGKVLVMSALTLALLVVMLHLVIISNTDTQCEKIFYKK